MVTAEDLPYIPAAAKRLSIMLRAIALLGAAGAPSSAPTSERRRAALATRRRGHQRRDDRRGSREPDVPRPRLRRQRGAYLVDLHEKKAVFDFCGGMMFQLVLTDALVDKLKGPDAPNVVIHDAATRRMSQVPGYDKSNYADDATFFHGREVRKVPNAAGGMNFVLQLSAVEDKDGWVAGKETATTAGARLVPRLARRQAPRGRGRRGVPGGGTGRTRFTLNHRFYLHLDNTNRLWLSAEDGCEGRLVDPGEKKKLFGLFWQPIV